LASKGRAIFFKIGELQQNLDIGPTAFSIQQMMQNLIENAVRYSGLGCEHATEVITPSQTNLMRF